MTDVVILHRIPGHKPGAITELTERLQRHVDAGNARIIPNRHDAWVVEEPAPAPRRSPLRILTGQGPAAPETVADADEATEPDAED